jgi:hypothetical protein
MSKPTYDYAAQIAALNPVTLADARRLRTKMINEADNRQQRDAIGAAFAPVLETLSLVE